MLDVGSCAVGCSRLSRRFHPLTQPVWAEAVARTSELLSC